MTNREFFNAIITGTVVLNAGKETETSYPAYEDGELIGELKTFAEAAIAKLDKKNEAAKGRERKSTTNPENEALKAKILEVAEPNTTYTAKAVAETLGVSTQKASALLRALVNDGSLVAVEVKKNATKEYVLP